MKSKKKKIIALSVLAVLLLAVVLVLVFGTSHRKAMRQLGDVSVLHADKTTILDGEQKAISLHSKSVVLKSLEFDISEIQRILDNAEHNSVCLQIHGDLIDTSSQVWVLPQELYAQIDDVLERCTKAKKYLLLDIVEYPEQYRAWVEGSDYPQTLASLWGDIAKRYEGEAYLGAYVLDHFARPGASKNDAALTHMETFLQTVCDSIRQNDQLHMIAIGMMAPYMESEDKYHALPFVKDRNFIYTAALEPLDFYDEQSQTSLDGAMHLSYPSTYWQHIVGQDTQDTVIGKSISVDTTESQTVDSGVFQVEADGYFARIGVQVEPADSEGGGELRIISARMMECDEKGNEKAVLYNMDFSAGVPFDYFGNSGTMGASSVYEADGSAYLESISEGLFMYVSDLNIPLENGKYYKLSVTVKQRGMRMGYSCSAAVQLYTCTGYDQLNKALMEKSCNALLVEAEKVGVPFLFSDIGVNENVSEEKGKDAFLSDLKAVLKQTGQSFIES